MNKSRRKEIQDVASRVSELESLRDELVAALEGPRDEEQEYWDNMPESFQNADKGYAAQEAIDALDNAISALEDIDIDSITSYLEEAQN